MSKILVVDDDQDILLSVAMLLEMEGYQVEQGHDGQALMKLTQTDADIILLDIFLSGMHGGEITAALKQNPATRHIPVILFSANRDLAAIAKKSGADDFLIKPFDAQELFSKLEQHLARTRKDNPPFGQT